MPLVRITNGFDRLGDPQLLTRATEIVSAMTDNPNFPNPDPSLATVTSAVQAFQTALMAALTGNRYDINTKNQKRQELIDLLHNLGNYVLYVSKLDAVVAASSGFKVAKTPSPAPELTKPENITLSDGVNVGELTVTFSKVPAAKSYLYQYTKDPITADSVWESKNGTVSKTTFKNLQSKERYCVRIAALGINGQLVYSNVATRVVQ